MEKSIRNELLGMLADVNDLISSFECDRGLSKEKAAEIVPQLLNAYSIKIQVLDRLNRF